MTLNLNQKPNINLKVQHNGGLPNKLLFWHFSLLDNTFKYYSKKAWMMVAGLFSRLDKIWRSDTCFLCQNFLPRTPANHFQWKISLSHIIANIITEPHMLMKAQRVDIEYWMPCVLNDHHNHYPRYWFIKTCITTLWL